MRHYSWSGGIFTFVFALMLGVIVGSTAPHPGAALVSSEIEVSELLN